VNSQARIHLCGRLSVEWDGDRLERALPGRQGRLLFAYLTLHRDRPVRRDELVDALWSEEDAPAGGDTLLAPPLSRLRKALGPGRLEGRAELQLTLPEDAWIDWEVAHDGLRRAREALRSSDWQAAWGPARAALTIAERGLLPGLEALWIDQLRTQLADLRVEALEAVATIGVRLGGAELPAAEQAARAAVEAAPFRESARAALIEALRAGGNVAEALRAYDDLRVLLRDELGTTPGPELVALHEQLLRAEPATVSVTTSAPPSGDNGGANSQRVIPDRLAAVAAGTPLVGRDAELARLMAGVDAVRAGRSALFLITGDGGIGKTRLLAEAALRAEGFQIVYGRCDEEELYPMGPWIESIGGHLLRASDADLLALVGDDGPALVGLLPELRRRLPDLADAPVVDAETERRRLFDALSSVTRRIAARAPTIAVIDDLHWADRASLLMARHQVRAPDLGPVLLIGTFRDNELAPGHPLTEVLADLERDEPLPRIHLTGLDAEQTSALAGVWHGEPLRDATVRAIHAETDGNPFFIKQLIRHLEQTGQVDATGEHGLGVPAGLKDVLARRVARLPDEAGTVLRVAALIGRDFDLGTLERVVDLDEDALLDVLDEAVRAGLLVEVASAPGRYSFVHALIRAALVDELTATRRARLHRRIGEALERRYRTRLDPHLPELARHFAAAGPDEVDRAVDYALRAAGQATERLAYDEAVAFIEGALAARERDEPVDEAERARLLHLLAAAQLRAGSWDRARETWGRAATAAAEAGTPQLFAEVALGFAGGVFERYGQEDADAATLLEQALVRLPDRPSALRARVLARLAGVLYWTPGTADRVVGLVEEALAMARAIGDQEALTIALDAAMFAYWRPGMHAARWQIAEELVTVAEGLDDLPLRARAYYWRSVLAWQACDRERGDADVDRHAALAEQLQQPELQMHAAARRAFRALLEGDWAAGEEAAMAILGLGPRSQAVDALQFFGTAMLQLRAEQDRLPELLEAFEYTASQAEEVPGWRAPVAWARVQAGDAETGRAIVRDLAAGDFAVLPRDGNFLVAVVLVAHVIGELGDPELAPQVETALRPYADLWAILGTGGASLGPIAYSLGQAALLRGDLAQAEADLRRALELSEAMRSRPYAARSHALLAQALTGAEAAEHRAAALAIARELDMIRLLRELG
jgi:DNA-binding SARP family transcriptional activator